MTINEYILIEDIFTKLQQLWVHGSEVSRKVRGASTFLLYQLKDFYVEIEYVSSLKNIVAIKAFQDGILLDQYITDIDISPLLNT